MSLLNKILIRSRLKLVCKVVDEIIEKSMQGHKSLFDDFHGIKSTISKGVEKKYLADIEFIGRKNNLILCSFCISIDWSQHKVFYSTSEQTFEFDSDTSILEQVSKAASRISQLMNKEISRNNLNKIDVYFGYTGHTSHTIIQRELGLQKIDKGQQKEYDKYEKNSIGVNVRPGRLKELGISMRKRKG